MKRVHRLFCVALIMLSVFVAGIFISYTLDQDSGRLDVKTVFILDGSRQLSGLLYRPNFASVETPVPGIVLAHGIGGSKEMISGIGLELARRGFVALCLDLLGHGGSGGSVEEGNVEPSFGVLSAVHYLRAQPFVNASAIGLVGHSLGAGAVRAAFVADGDIGASVLIAGGFGEMINSSAYGVLSPTFPENLLVIVGKYDVLFDLAQLETNDLPPVFGAQHVVPGLLYGDFPSHTARELVAPSTTHLFEPIDPLVVSSITSWMRASFKSWDRLDATLDPGQTYLQRELAILVSLVALVGLVLLAFSFLARVSHPKPREEMAEKKPSNLGDLKAFGIWGALGLALFLPMSFVGSVISFPPLIFGASIAWWTFSVGLIGLFALTLVSPGLARAKSNLRAALVETFDKRHVVVALALFISLLVIASLLERVLNIELRIISPIFQSLVSVNRALCLLEFLPFFLAYFLVESLYFYEYRDWTGQQEGFSPHLLSWGKVVVGKVAPFVAVICVQYVPAILFGIWILSSYAGFLVEFLWLIIPIFAITTTCSWWLFRETGNVWTGAVFNALMMAWVAATVFPF